MWNQPYLETCCRSALHRLWLCDAPGRPGTEKDLPCLERLAGMGFATRAPNGRFYATPPGLARHATEVLHAHHPVAATRAAV